MQLLWARVNFRAMAMKGYSTFPKASALLDLNTRLFSVISRTFVGYRGSYPSAKKQSMYSTALANWAILVLINATFLFDQLLLLLLLLPSSKFDPHSRQKGIKIDNAITAKNNKKKAKTIIIVWNPPFYYLCTKSLKSKKQNLCTEHIQY